MIRVEREDDFRQVEEMVRDAFWNLYMPGANEHFILHRMRNKPEFIKELSLVYIDPSSSSQNILGHIAYTRSYIQDERDVDNKHEVVTFGPLSVEPSMKRKGIGFKLVTHSMDLAMKMGFRAVVIKGYPCYYKRFGFLNGKTFGIADSDGSFPKGLQVKELSDGALSGVSGRFIESSVFVTKENDLELFDKSFLFKEKFVTESQKMFEKMIFLKCDDPDPVDLEVKCRSVERILD